MRKTVIIALVVLLLTMLFVACNPNEAVNKFDTVTVSLQTVNEEVVKTLVSSNPAFDKDNFYWRYTAVKKDVGSKIGEKTSETNVKATGKGLGSLAGSFATGQWTFSLFAYSDSGFTKKVYAGSADVTFTGANAVETITVSVGPLSEGSGTLVIGKFAPKSGTPTSTTQVAYIVGGTTNTSKTDFPTTITDLASGIYTVTIELSYINGLETFKTASEPIQVAVYDNLATTISGNVDDLTLHVSVDTNGPFTVTFDSKGGSPVASLLVGKDGKVTTPTNPEREGCVFGGWTTDSNAYTSSTEFDFANTSITADTTLYAKWIFGVAFTASEGTVKIKMSKIGSAPNVSLQYSYDGKSWEDFVVGTTEVTVSATGTNKVAYFQAKEGIINKKFGSDTDWAWNYFTTSSTDNGTVSLSGNIMGLIDSTGNTIDFTSENECAFYSLFGDLDESKGVNPCITDASELVLPALTLADFCYNGLFQYCINLLKAPELPATTLTHCCYFTMFDGCSSLSEAPALPATTLAESCYYAMFSDCTELENTPVLSATILYKWCYGYMFKNCTKLTKAPSLPATTLEESCYQSMFEGCSSLKINNNGSTGTLFFTCPSVIPAGAVFNMFANTVGTFTNNPSSNGKYYWYTADCI